jgi:nitrous oxide reductase accessory protein NosL
MKRLALAVAVIAMAAACKKAEQQPAQQMSDSTSMMGDTSGMMMSDSAHMMAGDTAKQM